MTTIRNFGHYWARDLIDWGEQERPGTLLGALRVNADESDADFCNQMGIYVLYDNRDAVFVGQAGRGRNRLFHNLRKHSEGAFRDQWTAFSWFGFLDVGADGQLVEREDSNMPTQSHSETLDQLEALLLQVVKPSLNKRGANWTGACEYFQFVGKQSETPWLPERETYEKSTHVEVEAHQ